VFYHLSDRPSFFSFIWIPFHHRNFRFGRYFGDVEHIETITAWDTYNPRELSPRNRINLCRYDETTNQTIPQMDIAYAPESNAAKAIMDRVIDEISYSVS